MATYPKRHVRPLRPYGTTRDPKQVGCRLGETDAVLCEHSDRKRVREPVKDRQADIRPSEIHLHLPSPRCNDRRLLLKKGRCLLDARQVVNGREHAFAEPFTATRAKLKGRGTDDGVDNFACRARDVPLRGKHRKYQRDRDRDPQAGQQLLRRVGTQPTSIQVHQRTRTQHRP